MSLCPACNGESKVFNSRTTPRGWRWRRRRCLSCDYRYSTLEIPESSLTIDDPKPQPEPDTDG